MPIDIKWQPSGVKTVKRGSGSWRDVYVKTAIRGALENLSTEMKKEASKSKFLCKAVEATAFIVSTFYDQSFNPGDP